MRLDISSSSIANEHGEETLELCRVACRKYGFELGIQLHNTVSKETLDFAIKSKLPLTAHAPICGDYSLNLSTAQNLDTIFEAFNQNYELLKKLDISLSVFHGFAMTDNLIGSMKNSADYAKNLGLLKRDDLRNGINSVINIDFTKFPEYLERLALLKNNLITLRKRFKDITFCIENDLPVYGYAGMLMSDLIKLEHPICLDFGHLWCSSLAIDFDFYRELEIGLASARVEMIHFHNSAMTHQTDKQKLTDGHLNLDMQYEIDLQKGFNLLRKYDIDYLVLEISNCNYQDIEIIAKYLGR